MAAKLLLRNLLTVIKKFALPQGLSRNLSFDSSELALEQCGSYHIAEARRPGQLPREARKFKFFSAKTIVIATVFAVAGLGFSNKALAAYRVTAVNYGTQNGTATYGTGNSVTYTMTLSKAGGSNAVADNILLTWTGGTPTGVTWSFTGSGETITNGTTTTPSFTPSSTQPTTTITFTVTTTGATPANAYGFTIRLTDNNSGGGPFTSSGLTYTVNKKALTITGLTAANKIYDATTAATISGTPTLNGVLAGDAGNVSLSGTAVGTFSSTSVATGKTVTITGYTLSGSASGNYSITNPTTTANITQAPLTITGLTANDKVYDRTTTASFTGGTLVGVQGSDALTLTKSGTFATANVGSGIVVTSTSTVSGTNGNYSLTQPTGLSASITVKTLNVTGITASSRAYDGTTNVTLTGTAALSGVVSGDGSNVTLGGSPTASFADPNVGTGKSVTVNGYTISGSASGNYSLTQPTLLTANITAVNLNVTNITADNKVYDRTTAATFSGTPTLGAGVVNGDAVTLNTGSATAAFTSAAVGNGKTVNVSGFTITQPASNYNLVQPTALTANITAVSLTLPDAAANNKPYDGNTNATITGTLTGILSGDVVTLNGTGTFASSAVGNGIAVTSTSTLSGAQAGNYTLTQPTGLSANIIGNTLTITAKPQNKVYGVALSQVTSSTQFTATGLASGESVSSVTLNFGSGSASFDPATTYSGSITPSAPVGSYNPANYNIVYVNGDLTVTKAQLNVTNITASDKVYDGTTSATITGTPTLSGVMNNDDVSLVTGSVTSAFASAAVGSNKTVNVNGYSISGAAFGNYNLVQPTTLTANITGAPLTLTATGPLKPYGLALTTGTSATNFNASGMVGSETVTSVTLTPDAAGQSATTAVGSPYVVTPSLPTGGGGFLASNYIVAPVAYNGTVTAPTISYSGSPYTFIRSFSTNITTVSPVVTGTPTSYAITPSLNNNTNLNFSTSSGNISGTPSSNNGPTTYTVTATYTGGVTAQTTLSVTVVSSVSLTYTGSPFTYNYGIAISPLTPGGNGTPSSYTVSPALPTGLSLNATTGVVSGTPLQVVSTGTNYVVTSHYTGTNNTATATLNIKVNAPTLTYTGSPFTYVAGTAISSLSPSGSSGATGYSVSPALPAGLSIDPGTGIVSGTPTAAASAANYVVTATYSGGATAQATLNIQVNSPTLSYAGSPFTYVISKTITPANPTFTGTPVSYSGTLPDGLSVNSSTGQITGAPTTLSDAALYTITANYAAGITATANVSIAVVNPTLTITANNKTMAYGASVPTLDVTYTGFINGDDASSVTGLSVTTTGTSTSNVGSYPITASGATAPSYYTIVYAPGTLTITAAPVTITGLTANNKPYDRTNTATFTGGTLSGVMVADQPNVTLVPSGTFATANAGNGIAVTSTSTLTGSAAANYAITQPTGLTANITQIALTITANDVTKTYSATLTNGSSTAFTSAGLISPETVGSVTMTYGTGAASGAAVGNYPGQATPSAATGGSFTAANYNITYVSGAINVVNPTITYPATTYTFLRNTGTNITTITPTITGSPTAGSGLISPSLNTNTGLTFSTTTGAFSGRPNTASAMTPYTITFSYPGGATAQTTVNVAVVTSVSLSYAGTPFTFSYGTAITPLSPTVTASPLSYSVSPALPTGLSLNTSTGVISGTPTVVQGQNTYTVTATYNNTTTTAQVRITVTAPTLSYSGSPFTYYTGSAISSLSPTVSTAPNNYTVSPALPAGLSLDPSTGIVSGTPTAAVAAGNYVISANYNGGVTAQATLNIQVQAPTLSYAGTPFSFTLNTAITPASPTVTGTPVSYSVSPALPTALTVDPSTGIISGTPAATSAAANYTITANYAGGVTAQAVISVTVNNPTLTITADNQTMTYGSAVPTLTISYSGFINGDTPGSLTTLPSISTTATSASPVGSYPISISGAVAPAYYNVVYVQGNVTVSPVQLTITGMTAANKVYNKNTTASLSGGTLVGVLPADAGNVNLVQTGAFASANAGNGITVNSTSTITGSAIANYTLVQPTGITANITKKPLTIPTSGISLVTPRIYNQSTAAQLTGSLTSTLGTSNGVISGDVVALGGAINPPTGTFTDANAGIGKTINVTSPTLSGPAAANYSINITITGDITPAPVGLASPAGVNKVYDGTTAATITGTLTGTISGDQVTYNGVGNFVTASAGNGISIVPAITLSGAQASNYAISQPTGVSANITKAPLTITANNQTKPYGTTFNFIGTEFTFVNVNNTSNTSALYASDNITSVNFASAGAAATATVTGGPYSIVPSGAAGSGVSNYNISYVNGSMTVTPVSIAVTANPQTKNYGDADPTLTYQITSGALANSDTFSGSLTRAPGENVGTYAISQGSLALSSNYSLSFTGNNLNIGTRSIAVTADPQSKSYGDSDPPLTYQITSGSLANGDTFSGTLTRAPGEVVGTYAISQGSLALSSNYNLSFTGNNLSIGTRAIAVTADPQTKNYGDNDPTLSYQITSGNLVNGDTFNGALTRATGEDVGTYSISQGTLALSSNYNLSFTGNNLTIGTRAIAVTADPQTKSYGDNDPTLSYQITSGSLVNGDTFSGALTRATGEDVGTYAISQGTLALSSNYNLSFTGDNLTIGTRSIAVAADPQSKNYGDADPTLTYQITNGNLVNGDTFSGALTRAAGEDVGTYAISKGSLALSPNYNLSFTGNSLSIGTRSIAVTADPQTKTYGDNDPTLTYQITNGSLANGDTFTGALTRVAGEDVGSYDISQGTLALSSNYALTVTGNTLTIGTRSIAVAADPQTKNYGDNDPTLSYQITSGSLAFEDTFSGALTRTSGEDVGTYPISQGSLALSPNYNLSFTGNNLTIGTRSIAVAADPQTKNYGDTDPTLSYQITNGSLANGDTFSGALTRASGEDVGTYAISKGTLALSSNYNLSFTGDNLTIGTRAIAVTADPQTKNYGDADPTLSYQITSGNLVNGDTFSGALTRATGEDVGTYAISQGTLALSSNYNLSFTGDNLTIGTRAIAVAADPQSKNYGEADPALTYQITSGNLVNGDTFSGALTRTAGEDVGSYPISQGSLALSANYNLSFTGNSLSIGTRSITVTADPQTKTYGDADPTLSYQITSGSLASGDAFTGSLTRASGESVGTYAISQGSLALPSNYNVTFVGDNLTIGTRSIAVAADPQTKNYGDSDPTLSYQITSGNLVNGDTFSGSLTRVTGEDVGSYDISQGTLALSSNYALTVTGNTLSIGTRAIAVAADPQTKNYGDADPTLSYQITSGNLVNGDTFSGTLTRVAGENVGTYAISQGTLALSSNYNLSFTGDNLTIGTRAIAVTADPQTKNYGDNDPALTYQYTGTLVNGDTFSGALTRATGENVGTYAISQGTLALSANYALSFTGDNLTIGTRAIAVAADPQSKNYGEADPALTYQITSGNLVNGDTFSGALTRTAGEDVGSYPISQGSLALSPNYNLSFTGNSLSIGTRSVTVTADPQSKNYGDNDPTLSYQITSGSLADGDAFTGSLTRASGENVGTYAISQGSLALPSNYNVTFIGNNLTIGTRSIAVAADPQNKNYGDNDPTLSYQITSGNLVNGDTFSGALTRVAGENVGSYDISQGTLALSDNYALTVTGNTLTIGTRAVAVTADPQTKNYGDADPTLSYQITSGNLVNGDTFSGALTRAAGENVGTYAISQGTLALSSNYNLSFTGDNLTIGTRAIAVTADPQTKNYGEADPTLSYQYTGTLVNGDTFSGALTRVSGENVGTYAISQGSLALSANYNLSFTGDNLTIGTRAIAVAADPQSKNYGEADPPLTYQITSGNLVNGDTFSGALTRAPGEDVGSYAISQGSLALSANYNLSFTGNSLSIGTRSVTVTADAQTKNYGDADPTLSYQITSGSLASGDTFSGSLTRAAGENVGTYAISQGSLALPSNYNVTFVGNNLTIGTRSIAVAADHQTKNYGDSDPTLSYQITSGNLVNGDTFSGALTRVAGENVGSYAISQGTLALSSNYALTVTGNTLTIGTRAIAVTADPQTKNYGDADPTLSYQITSGNLVNGDTFSGALTRATGEDVGTYAISQGTLALSANYSLSFTGDNLTIGTRSIAVAADAKAKNYGDADPALTYQITSGNLVNGDTFNGALTRAPGENVGTYAISQGSLALSANYNLSFTGNNLTIGTRTITVTADVQSKNYGDADPTLTYQYTGTLANGDTFAGALTRASGENVGTYAISQGSLALPSNYNLSFTGNTLTIGTRAIAVAADAKAKNYGDADPALTYQITNGSLANGDTFSGALTRAAGENVGTYAISQGSLALSPNYNLSFTGNNLTIGTNVLTITANNDTKVYGETQTFAGTEFVAAGLKNGDNINTVTLFSAGADASAAVNNYPIVPSNPVAAQGTNLSNYDIHYVNGTDAVGQAILTIKADNKTIFYGDPIPQLTVSYSGFVNNETYTDLPTQATASTTATAASGVGDYVISVGGAIDNNYSFNYINGNLRINAVPIVFNPILPQTYGAADLDPGATSNAGITYTSSNTNVASIVAGQIHIKAAGSTLITANNGSSTQSQTLLVNPAPLTVTADNQSKAYGANNPALTVSYSGFVNGDTQNSLTTQATATTTATVASPVGNYPINVTGGAVDPNYTFTYVAGTLTVGTATLTVTADNSSKVYGAANPAFTVSYSGFMNGDTKANLTTQATVSTSATTASPVGSYDLVPAGAASSNYTFNYVNGTLNVTPAGLLITANNQTKAYGAGIPPFTASFSGFVNGDNSNTALSTQPTLNTTATASSPIGTYPITASGAVAANYTITYAPGTLTVGQANLVITPNPISKVYGAAIPALTASYSGLANGDTPASLTTQPTLSTTATASSPIGTYLITATGASSPNYNITYNTGNLTVTPATLTITANNLSKTYGTANPTLTVSYSGFVNGETRTNLTTRPTITTTATTNSPAGAYPITASGAVDPNYTFVYVQGTLTVNPAVLTVTAADKAKTYGANNPNLTVTYSGWVNGDTQTSLTTPATATTTATAASPVGDYPITPAGAVNPNYTFNYVGGTLTVGQATLTIAANTMAKTYGSPNPALTVSYSGFVNGDGQANLLGQPIVATTATNSSPVGNYPITASGAYSPNYNINYLQGTMIVTQVALFISADNQTKVAGAANPTLTASYSGFVNGDTQANLTTQPTLSTTATTNSPAGTYPISVSGAVDPNYSIAYASGTMTVTSTPLTFAAIPAKTYGTADFDPGASSASPITYTSSNPAVATIVSGNIHIIGVGNSVITATSGSSSLTQLLIVNPASLTIIANGVTKSYGVALTGGAGSTGTFFPLGLVNGEAIGSVTITYGSGAAANAAVGTYNGSVAASGATGGTFNPNNYSINYVSNNITVQAVALTITANNQAKNYGAANPALTLSYSGFVNGDNQASLSTPPTVSTSAVTNSPVGSYPINVSGAASNNYSISYNNGTLTVGQAALVISADNHAKNYGSVNPALTITYSGFVNGENSANLTTLPTISTTATTSSSIGNYPITVSGAVDGNYSISYTAGTMTVTPAALTITADNQTKTYGWANPALTISYSGFVNGDNQGSLTTLPVASTSATTASGVGSYPITVSGAVNPNYSFIYNAGTLTVTPAALTITANNQTKTQGAANPPLTLSYSGYMNGETVANLAVQPTVSTTATTNSPVGPYPITVGGASDPDYSISFVQGTLTVVGNPLAFGSIPSKVYGAGDFNPGATSSNSITYSSSNPAVATIVSGNVHIVGAGSSTITADDGTTSIQQALNVSVAPLTITANNASKTYGAANPALSAGYSGFVNGDTQANLTTLPTVSTTAVTGSAVGTYPITASGAASNNYSITYNAGTLTVGQASLTITANNQSKTYGSANPSLTVGYSGFVNGDNNTTALTTQATVSTTATVSSPVGSYPISASGAVSANYSISYAQGTLTIGQAALTITADNQSKVQGAANPTLTASYNGFVNGDTQANLTTLPTVTTTATTGSPAGTYPITASGAASANYSMSYVQGTLTVNGSLTFNAIASKVYGAADFNPGATSTGGAITYSSGNTAVATIVSGNIHIVGVGTSTITANNGTSSLQQTLTVTPAALTATANNASKTYGAANPALSVSYSGYVNGDNSSVVTTPATVTTTATASSAVGSYPVTASGANAANYSISYVQGTLTVGQAALTITADNQSKVQGAVNPTLTASYSGFVNGDTQSNLTTLPTVTTTATTGSPAGTYPITASGAASANYSISYVQGTLTVTGSLTFNAIASKVYGTADFNPGATGTGTITYTSGNTAVATIVSGNIHIVGVGTSTITASNGTSSLQQTLTVTPASLSITANNVSKAYGTAISGAAGSTAFTSSGLVNGQTIGTVTIAYGTGSAATAAAGTYNGAVTPSAATGGTFTAGNYAITYNNGNIVVTPVALTITANNQTKVQGAANPALTVSYSGFVNGQTNTALTTQPTVTTTAVTGSPVGTYPITASGAVDANYTISYVAGTLTVTAANSLTFNAIPSKVYGTADFSPGATGTGTITYTSGNTAVATIVSGNIHIVGVGTSTITASNGTSSLQQTLTVTRAALSITANNVNKTYGAALTGGAGSAAFTSTGLVNGQTIGSVTIAYGTGSAATAAVNTYTGAVTPSAATGGTFNANNYTITYNSGNIVVGRAAVTITAANKTKTQGTANPALTVTYSGFVNGETNAVLTTQPTVTTTAVTNSPVGTYPITASGAVAANYSFTYVQGTMTVTGAANTLTFAAIPSKVYGAANFGPGATTTTGTITYTSSNSAVATIVSSQIHIVGIGTSTITASNGTSSLQQTLTVTPATLTIYAYDINKNYGSSLTSGSGLTYFQPNGLQYGETIGSVTLTFGAAAATTTAVGTYANQVTATAATGGTFKPANYNITYVQGKIIVNKKVLTITAANKTKAQGTANPALTVTYSGFANGETNTVLTTQPTATTTATISSPMGNYPITANGAAANNYSFTYVQGTLTITNPSNASIISVNNPEHVTYIPVEEPVVRQAVSPNGDGINDVLHIDNIESYPDNKVMLMNRNGTTIYEMTGYDNTNKVFDGHSNITKEMQQPGTYFYMVEYKVKGGETKRKTGYFVIKY